ncbi:MAG: NAD(P)H-dependent glycerol-3-phosphate dehydrogenase [Bacteroides sp.]|nr:NAD(P)H-dependent glycerol-3-phosphate dehydrogenase [Bacteroides sp.]MCM1549836.1 NAD(P)H-dependent glycerol-3-phosphate dehydrogenase [Clostridium sp.]
MKISVLGAGSWGTALAVLLCENGHTVTLWSIDQREVAMIDEKREQVEKLPGVVIPKELQVTGNLEECIAGRELLVLAVPSIYIRSTARMMAGFVKKGQIIVNVAKGIEEQTLLNMTDVIEEEIPHAEVGVLSGPSHAEEVGRRIPTTVVAGAHKKEIAEVIQDAFMNSYFRVYTSPDMVGIELGAALKNVIALAAGIVDGLGFGDNTKAALITRGIAEITRLGTAMGGRVETFAGLSGIGDLIVTCTSTHSRNHNAGYLIGQGKTYQEAMDEVKMVVEGVYSAKAALALAKKYQVEVPITEQINRVLFEGIPAMEAVPSLLLRNRTAESEW